MARSPGPAGIAVTCAGGVAAVASASESESSPDASASSPPSPSPPRTAGSLGDPLAGDAVRAPAAAGAVSAPQRGATFGVTPASGGTTAGTNPAPPEPFAQDAAKSAPKTRAAGGRLDDENMSETSTRPIGPSARRLRSTSCLSNRRERRALRDAGYGGLLNRPERREQRVGVFGRTDRDPQFVGETRRVEVAHEDARRREGGMDSASAVARHR